jgi:predicted MFS family arabinose efflux permease
LVASIGQFIKEVALYWVAYDITGSAFALGILGLCDAGPRLILSMLGGVLVDRYDRLRLMILMQFMSAMPVFVLFFLYAAGLLEFWHILVLEIWYAIIRTISPSVSQSLIRDLATDRELLNAVALSTIGFNFARVVGPSLGGVLMLWIGAGGTFILHALTLVISGVQMMPIRVARRAPAGRETNVAREITEGLRYIRHAPVILCSIGTAYAISAFVGSYPRFLPVFAKEILNVGPQGLGILLAAPGLGAVLALVFLSYVGQEWRRDTLMGVAAILTPLFLILFCSSQSFFFSVLFLTLLGAGHIAFRTVSRVIIQFEVPNDLLGRVMSVFVMDQGMRSVGSLILGSAATLLGAPLGLSVTSAVCVMLTAFLFYRLRARPDRA